MVSLSTKKANFLAVDDSVSQVKSPREATIESIIRLGSHLAQSVVEFLVEEIELHEKPEIDSVISSDKIGSIISIPEDHTIHTKIEDATRDDTESSVTFSFDDYDIQEVLFPTRTATSDLSVILDDVVVDDDDLQQINTNFYNNRVMRAAIENLDESFTCYSDESVTCSSASDDPEVSQTSGDYSDFRKFVIKTPPGQSEICSCGDSSDKSHVNDEPPTKKRISRRLSRLNQRRFLDQQQLCELSSGSDTEDDLSLMTVLAQESVTSLSEARTENIHARLRRKDSAILFVDISGFTKLSAALEIETLSKLINNYFERIVNIIKEYGGDILRFAGDALLAEWQASLPLQDDKKDKSMGQSSESNLRINEYSREETVLMASLCASKLANKLCDFPVVANSKKITTLNLHCGIGFGQVVGVHVGNNDRMEYLIIGDTIRQLADALALTNHGDVAASPEVLELLGKSVKFQKSFAGENSPQIIASKSEACFHTTETFCLPSNENFMERIVTKCSNWNDSALGLLQRGMSRYVHPVVLCDQASLQNKKNEYVTEIHKPEAELRQIFTVFIQPEINANLMGHSADDKKLLELLNQLMVIVNSELIRFGGHLRQFIVDDKGLVIIANFGLRGSTFPNMIEERAMPFMTNIKTLLKTELNLVCKLGATYGNVYCGVVGAYSRHEYAVLGPSVNLAARLMKHPENPGVLVDNAVREKAGLHPFVPLPPVHAKGYDDPVKIFKPEDAIRKMWKDIGDDFVGRVKELSMLSSVAQNIISCPKSSHVVLVSGPYGSGKSSVLSRSTKQIKNLCQNRNVPYHVSCHICCDDDSFRPFSIVRPIFLDIIVAKSQNSTCTTVECIGHQENEIKVNEAQLFVSLLQLCLEAKVPGKYIEIFGGLIFTNRLSDIGKWSNRSQKMSEWNDIACNLAKALVHAFASYGLVLLALDDISAMDEMSWKVIQLLQEQSSNLLIIGTSRNSFDMNIDPDVWDDLKGGGRFTHLKLSPMDKVDMCKLVGRVMGLADCETIQKKVTQSVYFQSDGNPFIASEIIRKLYKKNQNDEHSLTNLGSVGELLLNRLDSLSPSVRLLLNLGAILGFSFHFVDIVTIMNRYNKIEEKKQVHHEEFLRNCLNEAVKYGILDEAITSYYGMKYTFSHRFWRENILKLTLDEWKNKMLGLIADRKPFLHLCSNLEEEVNHQLDKVNTHANNFNQKLEKLRLSLDDTITRDNNLQRQLQNLQRMSLKLKQRI